MKATMNLPLVVHFGLLILLFSSFQQCETSTTKQPSYIFTLFDNKGVCIDKAKSPGEATKQQNHPIFTSETDIFKMDLGFLNRSAELTEDGYNMTTYGFPIFYEYLLESKHFEVIFIIANGNYGGTKSRFYYVKLIDKEDKCKDAYRPTEEWNTLGGSLYLNERYAKFAYYIYRSNKALCIFTIKFEDLYQGEYKDNINKNANNLVSIEPVAVTVIEKDYDLLPFFTIDPIFGTMVHLNIDGTQLSAVHCKIDENDLSNFQVVLTRSLVTNGLEMYNVFNLKEKLKEMNTPSFVSYGKFAYIYYHLENCENGPCKTGHVVYWPVKPHKDGTKEAKQRQLFYVNEDYFEWSEPIGMYQPPQPTTTPSPTTTTIKPVASSSTTVKTTTATSSALLTSTCSPVNSFNPTWAAFAPILVINILLVIALVVLIILKIKGSKNYAKCHPAAADRGGNDENAPNQLTIADETGVGTMNVTRKTGTLRLSEKAFTDVDNNTKTNIFAASKEGISTKPQKTNVQNVSTVLKTIE